MKTPEEMENMAILDISLIVHNDGEWFAAKKAWLAGYKAAQASNKISDHELWAIKTPNFGYAVNLLESSEALAWAKLYTIHTNSKHWVPPSRVPPDFIRGLKDIGYKAVRLMEAPNE